ncbi:MULTISPECIES: diaminopimelate epimerase [unclassified Mucilaginibacter]|uniref:diaminopimelate epimerase n=1 Tax=unclassified Mucilaginibacter TaxID=2617802 RepID=UPI002AC8A985|nr:MULTISPECIES: diaminopimelate epimerase [unclassified Mucilaginibacter]MEB0262581.1 diaminopimelate epimerase [Mucilaginibacter sp. 10I4]MEB0278388.1 diaminopimelate epimerase [Mucilaginibacter sp. 10B2]MEB0303171.1 diaminopimelate epimerase [Mucilaginibacter sp. 5C4]WPX24033.1 diaminopimelate epimerase [Mucilaginibacter sp. 5C4]
MQINFYKYQGAGNDFVLIDNRDSALKNLDKQAVAKLCDRRFGIGGDGLMLLENEPGFDFKMVYYNADGNEGSMCGNGGRCIVAFAKHLGIIANATKFLATDGIHHAKISDAGNWVSLQMIDVADVGKDGEAYVLNTGSPHYVKLATNLEVKDVYSEGYAIRNNPTYKQDGINVNFVEKSGEGYFVRTFERGVENETYACGTGVTAVALAMAKHNHQTGSVTTPIKVLGGDLNIRFDHDGEKFSNIFLEGPAELVFDGEIEM